MQEPFGIEPANFEVPWPHGDRVIRILGGNSMCPDRHQQLGQSEDFRKFGEPFLMQKHKFYCLL
jgi:hypothetical protein